MGAASHLHTSTLQTHMEINYQTSPPTVEVHGQPKHYPHLAALDMLRERVQCLTLSQSWKLLVEVGRTQLAEQVKQAGREMFGAGAFDEAMSINSPNFATELEKAIATD